MRNRRYRRRSHASPPPTAAPRGPSSQRPRPGQRPMFATLASSRRASSSAWAARCSTGSVTWLMDASEPPRDAEADDARAQRIMVANDRLGAAQRRAFWSDLADAGRPRGPGLRELARRFAAVARELSVPRGPLRGEGPPPISHVRSRREPHPYAAWATFRRNGVAALEPLPGGRATATPLHIAVVIPPFGFGSGGHEVVFRLTENSRRWATQSRCGSTIRSG